MYKTAQHRAASTLPSIVRCLPPPPLLIMARTAATERMSTQEFYAYKFRAKIQPQMPQQSPQSNEGAPKPPSAALAKRDDVLKPGPSSPVAPMQAEPRVSLAPHVQKHSPPPSRPPSLSPPPSTAPSISSSPKPMHARRGRRRRYESDDDYDPAHDADDEEAKREEDERAAIPAMHEKPKFVVGELEARRSSVVTNDAGNPERPRRIEESRVAIVVDDSGDGMPTVAKDVEEVPGGAAQHSDGESELSESPVDDVPRKREAAQVVGPVLPKLKRIFRKGVTPVATHDATSEEPAADSDSDASRPARKSARKRYGVVESDNSHSEAEPDDLSVRKAKPGDASASYNKPVLARAKEQERIVSVDSESEQEAVWSAEPKPKRKDSHEPETALATNRTIRSSDSDSDSDSGIPTYLIGFKSRPGDSSFKPLS